MNAPLANRLLSLDVLRGIVILVMLFVNDLAGVSRVPTWLRHAPTFHDGMTVVDLVFPAFLFMVGMSLPFSVGRRLVQGESRVKIWAHVAVRCAGLIILGFFEVNGDAMAEGGVVSPDLWTLLLVFSAVLIWSDYGSWNTAHSRRVRVFRMAGWALLCAAAMLFKSNKGAGVPAMEPHWWGILGLVGWAYGAACVVYIFGRTRPEAVLGGIALFCAFAFVEQAGLLNWMPGIVTRWNPLSSVAPHAAIVLAGAVLGGIIQTGFGKATVWQRVRWTLVFIAGMYLASVVFHSLRHVHQMFIISKNLATVPWCLRCCSLTGLAWLVLYLLIDVRGVRFGTRFFSSVGANALFAYLLAPFAVALIQVVVHRFGSGDYGTLGNNFLPGLVRSIVHAFSLAWFAGFAVRHGFRLKL